MKIIFETSDKNGKLIRLTNKQHSHIMEEHPYMHKHIEEIKETLVKLDKIVSYLFDENVRYFHKV